MEKARTRDGEGKKRTFDSELMREMALLSERGRLKYMKVPTK